MHKTDWASLSSLYTKNCRQIALDLHNVIFFEQILSIKLLFIEKLSWHSLSFKLLKGLAIFWLNLNNFFFSQEMIECERDGEN